MIPAALAASLACALWGFAFVGPVMLPGVHPIAIAAGRYLAYGLSALALLAWRGRLRQPRPVWRDAATLSLLGNLLYYVALSAALHRAGVVLPTLIIGILPVSIPLAAALLAGRAPVALQWLGFALTLGGTWLARPDGDWGWQAGALWACGSLAVWTAYALVNPILLRRHPQLGSSDWAALQGLACLPFAMVMLAAGAPERIAGQWPTFIAISAFMGLVCSSFANSLWNWASLRLSANVLGPLIVVETIAGLVYGRVYTGTPWRSIELYGAGLLLLGVAIALWAEHRQRSATR